MWKQVLLFALNSKANFGVLLILIVQNFVIYILKT